MIEILKSLFYHFTPVCNTENKIILHERFGQK